MCHFHFHHHLLMSQWLHLVLYVDCRVKLYKKSLRVKEDIPIVYGELLEVLLYYNF